MNASSCTVALGEIQGQLLLALDPDAIEPPEEQIFPEA